MVEIEERKIAVGDLKIGMFVCRLDRPWNGTPFPLQGFLVRSPKLVDKVREFCTFVYVDIERGLEPEAHQILGEHIVSSELQAMRGPFVYADTSSLEEEAPNARLAHDNASAMVAKIVEDIRAGRALSAEDVDQAVRPVVKSILRSANAFFWIDSLRKRDTYAYSHAINCAALAAAFGRHMGFAENVLVTLAAGGLLMDVGKIELPDELLTRPAPLDAKEMEIARRHVENGLGILDRASVHDNAIRDVVRTHHERWNGTGYPRRMLGTQIPLFGRMTAIIDCFDAMTSPRPYRAAIARHEMLQNLYRWRDEAFQGELVEQFLLCLGVYPTGSLVELSTGEVAIVMAQNQARRLRPRVVVLTNSDKELNSNFPVLDLMAQARDDAQVDIVRALEPGSYGLDPTELYL